jgi:S1-C subfamily serine protease
LTGRQPLAGAVVVNLSPAVADQYGLDPLLTGVIIIKADAGLAAQAGFKAGDIVRSVNGRAIRSTAALEEALRATGWRIVIDRNGRQIAASFGL